MRSQDFVSLWQIWTAGQNLKKKIDMLVWKVISNIAILKSKYMDAEWMGNYHLF